MSLCHYVISENMPYYFMLLQKCFHVVMSCGFGEQSKKMFIAFWGIPYVQNSENGQEVKAMIQSLLKLGTYKHDTPFQIIFNEVYARLQ